MAHTKGTLSAILRQKCPRCRVGGIFNGLTATNRACPHCGLVFEREPGYFIGAMYFSYALAVALLGAFYLVVSLLLPDWNTNLQALIALLAYLPFVPAVFRYSRTLWMYFDRHFWPGELSE